MTTLPTATVLPAELCERDQWICWDERPTGKDGKPRKVPIQPGSSRFASTTNSETWASFEQARDSASSGSVSGLGFVFTDDDPFVGVDLDDARDPETGDPEPWAESIVETLDSYTEISPSGTGYHVITTGELPPGRNRRGNVECYETARFFTVTGDHVDTTPETIHERRRGLFEVYAEHVAEDDFELEDAPDTDGDEDDIPQPDVTLADEELLSRAQAADNGEKFSHLFDGSTQGYDSHSEADMALACLLAFWTGGDTTQMDRLFRQSGLMREKWDEVHYGDGQTYGEMTLSRAASVTDEYYEPQSDRETDEITPQTTDKRTHNDAPAESVQPPATSKTALHNRERERIETIRTLEQRLRELEAENERLRAERDALEATDNPEDDRNSGSHTAQGGLLSRLKRLFS